MFDSRHDLRLSSWGPAALFPSAPSKRPKRLCGLKESRESFWMTTYGEVNPAQRSHLAVRTRERQVQNLHHSCRVASCAVAYRPVLPQGLHLGISHGLDLEPVLADAIEALGNDRDYFELRTAYLKAA